MKKIIAYLMLGAVTATASAQVTSVDIKTDIRENTHGDYDFGIGAGLSIDLKNHFELAPAVNFYFPDKATCFQTECDLHYVFDITNQFHLYPLTGLGLDYWKAKHMDHSDTDLLLNIGGGLKYDFSDKVAGFAETKYQWTSDYEGAYFSIGIKIAI